MRDLDFYGKRDPGKGTGRRCEWCEKLLDDCECDPLESGEAWQWVESGPYADDLEDSDGDRERCEKCTQWHSTKECV